MYQALIISHTLIALGIVTLVLLQHGRGADAGAAFGSGASGTVFGAQGSASFLTRTTGVLAAHGCRMGDPTRIRNPTAC